jgi:hypothetical protein
MVLNFVRVFSLSEPSCVPDSGDGLRLISNQFVE